MIKAWFRFNPFLAISGERDIESPNHPLPGIKLELVGSGVSGQAQCYSASNGDPVWRITFSTPMQNANYGVLLNCSPVNDVNLAFLAAIYVFNQQIDYIDIHSTTGGDGETKMKLTVAIIE